MTGVGLPQEVLLQDEVSQQIQTDGTRSQHPGVKLLEVASLAEKLLSQFEDRSLDFRSAFDRVYGESPVDYLDRWYGNARR